MICFNHLFYLPIVCHIWIMFAGSEQSWSLDLVPSFQLHKSSGSLCQNHYNGQPGSWTISSWSGSGPQKVQVLGRPDIGHCLGKSGTGLGFRQSGTDLILRGSGLDSNSGSGCIIWLGSGSAIFIMTLYFYKSNIQRGKILKALRLTLQERLQVLHILVVLLGNGSVKSNVQVLRPDHQP